MERFRKRSVFSFAHVRPVLVIAHPQKVNRAVALLRKLHLALDSEFGLRNLGLSAGLPTSHRKLVRPRRNNSLPRVTDVTKISRIDGEVNVSGFSRRNTHASKPAKGAVRSTR